MIAAQTLQSLEAERSVLGALMLDADPADVADVFATLEPDDFGSKAHGAVFVAARELHREGTAIDVVTVCQKLTAMGALAMVGGAQALSSLADATPTTANLEHYARIVHDYGLRRRLAAVVREASANVADASVSVTDAAQKLVRTVLDLGEQTSRGRLQSSKVLMRTAFKKLEEDHRAGVDVTGLATGFYSLDAILGGGLQPGDLVVLAARPSMGKTQLALEVGLNAATSGDATVLFVSLEMSAAALMARIVASRARVDSRVMRSPRRLRAEDWSRLAPAFGLGTDKLQVVDDGGMTVDDVRAKARTCKARHGLGLVVVDYLQLLRATPGSRDRTREREVADMSAGLKALAKEVGAPVLCLAQLNRGLEARANKRPQLSDLRESGAIEQDADVVLFVHREAYFDKSKPDDVAEIIVAKQRNGPTGVACLGWETRFSRFYNRERQQ